MSIGGGASSGQSNSQTALDPQIKADWQSLYDRAVGAAGQGAPQQQVAGFTPVQNLGQLMTIDASQSGLRTLGGAADYAQGLEGFQPSQIGGGSINTGVDHYAAHDATAPAGSLMGEYSKVGNIAQGDLSQYLNPYTKDVYNTSLNQLDQARREAVNGNSATATSQGGEGAFNGSRAGVSDALTNRAFGQEASSLASSLNQGNFAQAQQAALTYNQAHQRTQEDNQNADLQARNTIYQGDLATALANQSAQNTAGQWNAGANNTAGMFNAGQNLTAQEQNAANSLTANAQHESLAQLLAGIGGQEQSAGLTAAGAVSGVGQQQQDLIQKMLDTSYQNQLSSQNLPLQQIESAFGIIPSTGSGGSSTTHSSGKSGNVGF